MTEQKEIANTGPVPIDQNALVTMPYAQYIHEITQAGGKRIDAELDKICVDLNILIEQSSRAVCTNSEEFTKCGDLVKLLNARVKMIEELREERTGPIHKAKKAFDALFKNRSTPAESAAEHITKKIMKPWADSEEKRVREENLRRQREAEEAALANAARLEAEAKALRDAETKAAERGDTVTATAMAERALETEQKVDATLEAPAALPVADTAVRRQHGMYGSTSGVRKVWQTKVVDISKLPPAYIAAINADEKALERIRIAIKPLVDAAVQAAGDKAVQSGVVEIPGLAVTHESDISVR